MDAALREIRLALLEADVHFKVAKQLLERVRERAIGQEVLKSLSPDQAVLRIVRDEMVALLGGDEPREDPDLAQPPSVVLMTGLQGSGKTTTSAKLGALASRSRRPPSAARLDRRLPAGRARAAPHVGDAAPASRSTIPPSSTSRAAILRSALDEARAVGHDFVLVDTAGRLHIDDELMTELQELKALAAAQRDPLRGRRHDRPGRGQERRGVPPADRHHRDRAQQARRRRARRRRPVARPRSRAARSSSRAWASAWTSSSPSSPRAWSAASSAWATCSASSRRPSSIVDREQAEEMVRKLRRSEFTLEDYREQLGQLRKMGPLDQVLSMIPGIGSTAQGRRRGRGREGDAPRASPSSTP